VTDGTVQPGDASNESRQVIKIQASDGGVAAYHIDQVIVEGLAALKAATTVLPLEAMADVASPFVGRETELRQVGELLSADGEAANSSIVVVSGPPGVGKTALVREASKAARENGQFSHVLFVDLRGYEQDPDARVQPDAVLSKLLLLFGVDDADIPADPAAQAIQYQERLTLLASQGKSVLLWLDNASDPSQFDSLRPASPVHKVAVTTRETFGHIPRRQVVDVDLMSSDEAVALLAASARDSNLPDQRFTEEEEAVRQVAELCDHLPLALRIVAALLADEPDRPIAEMVDELAGEEDRLNSLEYGSELSVRAAFALSYKRLPENLQRLFRLLSVVPGGDVGWETAGLLIGATPPAARPQLMALVRSHLVQQHVRNRWSMHDLIRLYSVELSAEEPDDAAQAFTKVTRRYVVGVAAAVEWLTAVVGDTARRLFTSPEHAAAWFEAERPTAIAIVMSLARRPDQQQMLLAFTIALGEVLKSQRHWLKDFHDVVAIGATVALDAEDKHAGACVLNLYGAALRQMGRFDDALDVLQRSLNLAEENDDVSAAGAANSNMANVFFDQGRIDEALEVYWEDVRKCREADPPHRYNEAGTLSNIGAALAMNDRFVEAIEPLREAMEIRRQLEDPPGIASLQRTSAVFSCVWVGKRTVGSVSKKRSTCSRRPPRFTGNAATSPVQPISPTTWGKRSACSVDSATGFRILRRRSSTLTGPAKPIWLPRFAKTWKTSASTRVHAGERITMYNKVLGAPRILVVVAFASRTCRAASSR
jgi:tetratricopeptide (TPR) repeat protein